MGSFGEGLVEGLAGGLQGFLQAREARRRQMMETQRFNLEQQRVLAAIAASRAQIQHSQLLDKIATDQSTRAEQEWETKTRPSISITRPWVSETIAGARTPQMVSPMEYGLVDATYNKMLSDNLTQQVRAAQLTKLRETPSSTIINTPLGPMSNETWAKAVFGPVSVAEARARASVAGGSGGAVNQKRWDDVKVRAANDYYNHAKANFEENARLQYSLFAAGKLPATDSAGKVVLDRNGNPTYILPDSKQRMFIMSLQNTGAAPTLEQLQAYNIIPQDFETQLRTDAEAYGTKYANDVFGVGPKPGKRPRDKHKKPKFVGPRMKDLLSPENIPVPSSGTVPQSQSDEIDLWMRALSGEE